MTYKPGCGCRSCREAMGTPTRLDTARTFADRLVRRTGPATDDLVIDLRAPSPETVALLDAR